MEFGPDGVFYAVSPKTNESSSEDSNLIRLVKRVQDTDWVTLNVNVSKEDSIVATLRPRFKARALRMPRLHFYQQHSGRVTPSEQWGAYIGYTRIDDLAQMGEDSTFVGAPTFVAVSGSLTASGFSGSISFIPGKDARSSTLRTASGSLGFVDTIDAQGRHFVASTFVVDSHYGNYRLGEARFCDYAWPGSLVLQPGFEGPITELADYDDFALMGPCMNEFLTGGGGGGGGGEVCGGG